MTKYVYQLAGLQIEGDFFLPGLPTCAGSCELATVFVRRARIPVVPSPSEDVPHTEVTGDGAVLDFPNVARFQLRGHREILIDQDPASNNSDVRAYLLGTVFGLLCHQRGILPLHASAIDVEGGCVAFAGPSGAGKSTLAGALAARGHQVISDDVLFLRRDEDGCIQAWPGIGRLRLWQDSLAALGYDGREGEREFQGYDKYLVPLPPPQQPTAPRRLLRVYHVDAEKSDGISCIMRVRGAAAIELLMQNVYRLELAERFGYKAAAFSFCASAARQLPVLRFARTRGFDFLAQWVNNLENHLWNSC